MDPTQAPDAYAIHGFTGAQIRQITRKGMLYRRRQRFSLYTIVWLEVAGDRLESIRDVVHDMEYQELGGEGG